MNEARNLRDFLSLYNGLTQTCFKHCIYDFNHLQLDSSETSCVSRCIEKSSNCSRRFAEVFGQLGPLFMQRAQQQVNAASSPDQVAPTETSVEVEKH